MCLILLAWHAHPDYPLIFAGNRDEAYDRPSATADFWPADPRIFGGRDLEKGGTWLGVSVAGHMAAVTNYRDGLSRVKAPRSRGELTANFLGGNEGPRSYLDRVAPGSGSFGGFSLLVGDRDRLYCFSNRASGIEELLPGVHGLSNHLLNTPWPKVLRGKQRVTALLKAGEGELVGELFEALTDRATAPDAELPDTGVGVQRERELSPAFIAGVHYGTRASTVLLLSRNREVIFIERAFGARGRPLGEVARRFMLHTCMAGRDPKAASQDA